MVFRLKGTFETAWEQDARKPGILWTHLTYSQSPRPFASDLVGFWDRCRYPTKKFRSTLHRRQGLIINSAYLHKIEAIWVFSESTRAYATHAVVLVQMRVMPKAAKCVSAGSELPVLLATARCWLQHFLFRCTSQQMRGPVLVRSAE